MNQPDAGPAPFIHEVRVGWADCDPARIVYTAKIQGWALDAIDHWWEVHLNGNGWYQLCVDRNIGTPFVHMSLDFTAPITPRHRLLCAVTPVRLGNSSIEFRVVGRQNGVDCFTGRFVCVFVVSDAHRSIPAPADIRAVVQPLLRPLAQDSAGNQR